MIELNLSAAAIEQFHTDGFVVVDDILDADSVDLMRQRCGALFAGEFESGLIPDEVNWQSGRDPEGVTRQICNAWKGDRDIAGLILDPAIGRACAILGGWPGARINQDNLFWKPPGGAAVGFHQDSAYEDWVVPSDMVSCWIALDDTTADGGTVEYVRGSHRWGESNKIENFHSPNEPCKEMLDAARRAHVADPDRVSIVVSAGSAVFHHGWTWHGSDVNRSTRDRRSIVAHCMSSGARFSAENVGPIYSRYKRFGDDTMDESFFPILWREDGYRSLFLDSYAKRTIAWGGSA